MSVEAGPESARGGWWSAPLPLLLSSVVSELKQDTALHLVILAYAAVAASLALILGKPDHILVFSYVPVWIRVGAIVGLVLVTVIELPRAFAAAPRRPFSQFVTQVRQRITPRLLAGLVLFGGVALFYGAFTGVKSLLPTITPFSMDRWAADADHFLHGGHEPWRLLQPLLGHAPVTRFIQFLYLPIWTISLLGVTGFMAISRRVVASRRQFFWTFLLTWPLLGNVVAATVMTAGPCYYGAVTGDYARYGPLLAYLDFSRGMPLSSVDVQAWLWSAYVNGVANLGSGISAFPSLHVATATLFVLAASRIHRLLAAMFTAFALIIFAGSVHLGWHYAIDGYVSVLVVTTTWLVGGRLQRRGAAAADDRVLAAS